MASHSTSSVQETAERLAIGELIDAYASCAGRRDARGQMNLFTDDTRFVVYLDASADEPMQELLGREALAAVFRNMAFFGLKRPRIPRHALAPFDCYRFRILG